MKTRYFCKQCGEYHEGIIGKGNYGYQGLFSAHYEEKLKRDVEMRAWGENMAAEMKAEGEVKILA